MPDEPQDQQPLEEPSTQVPAPGSDFGISAEQPEELTPDVSSPVVPSEEMTVPPVEVEPASSQFESAPTENAGVNTSSVDGSDSTSFTTSEDTGILASSDQNMAPEFSQAPLTDPEPVSMPQVQPTTPSVTPSPSKNGGKKKWIIGGVIAVVLVLLIGSGVTAYNLWYQNPQKVISDGLINLLADQSSKQITMQASYENKDAKLTVSGNVRGNNDFANGSIKVQASFKNNTSGLSDVSFSVDMASTKTSAYFKVTGLKAAVDQFVNATVDSMANSYKSQGFSLSQSQIDQEKSLMLSEFNPIVNKVEGQWIQVDTNSSSSDPSASTQCEATAINKLTSNTSEQNELKKIYMSNPFITVKKSLGSTNGSLGYDLGFDDTKAKSFGEAFKNTVFAQQIKKCGGALSTSSDSSSMTNTTSTSLKNFDVQLWVSRWSHQVTDFKISGGTVSSQDGALNLDIGWKYGNVSGLSTPSNATNVTDLEKQINSLMGGSLTTGVSSGTTSI